MSTYEGVEKTFAGFTIQISQSFDRSENSAEIENFRKELQALSLDVTFLFLHLKTDLSPELKNKLKVAFILSQLVKEAPLSALSETAKNQLIQKFSFESRP